MPFLGKDWRSCGDQWIRTENGWERSKVLECILDNLSIGLRRENIKNKHKSFMSERNKRINSECDDEETTENKDISDRHRDSTSSSSSKSEDSNLREEKANNNENENNDGDHSDQDIFDELDFTSDEDDLNDEERHLKETNRNSFKLSRKHCNSLSKLSISNSSIERYYYKTRQPHIIYLDLDLMTNRVNF
jgi:hypothetical protein